MHPTDIDYVAIRFNPLSDTFGPSLRGLRPIVCSVEQGLHGAPHQGATILPESLSALAQPQLHHMERVIFVVDRSGSMAGHLHTQSPQQKSQYIQDKISAITKDYFPEETKVSLIQFDCQIERYNLAEVRDGAVSKLQQQLVAHWGGGGTEFGKPLRAALEILKQDYQSALLQSSSSEHAGVRSLVFFLTDGQDDRRSDLQPIIDEIRKHNATTFICGIGEGYDMRRILEIASLAGASAWSHVPLESGAPDVFDVQIPEIIRQIISEEHYIKVHARGDFVNFTALTPSIRDVAPGKTKIYSGYAGRSAALLLERHDNIHLTLQAGRHVGDRNPFAQEIPITDLSEAGPFYERAREGEALIEKFLVLHALRNRDLALLNAMMERNPSLEPVLSPAIEDLQRHRDVDYPGSHSINSAMSVTGYTVQGIHPSGPQPGKNDASASEIAKSRSQGSLPADGQRKVRSPHSGWLGPLDASAPLGPIPEASVYDPAVYKDMPPLQQLVPSLDIPSTVEVFVQQRLHRGPLNLVGLLENRHYIFGRLAWCDKDTDHTIRVALGSSAHMSRSHFKISARDGTYWITDLHSTCGTCLNTKILSPGVEYELRSGDRIGAGTVTSLLFRRPS